MTKQSNRKKTVLTVVLSSVGSIALGWALNKFGKEPMKEVYANASQRVKETTDQWYEDGRQRAQEFETIKIDIDSNL